MNPPKTMFQLSGVHCIGDRRAPLKGSIGVYRAPLKGSIGYRVPGLGLGLRFFWRGSFSRPIRRAI